MNAQEITLDPISVTTLAEVLPHGLHITGVALQYDREFDATGVPPTAFEVNFTSHAGYSDSLSERSRRNVVRAYTSNEPRFSADPLPGNYIILELRADDENAPGTWTDGRYTIVRDLNDVLLVTQLENIDLQGTRLKAQPGVTHTSTDSARLIADDFLAQEFRTSIGVDLPYRLFRPLEHGDLESGTGDGEGFPLVVALHGHGESGDDNLAQIVGNQVAVAFAAPERQSAEPAFVLAPQTPQGDVDGSDGVGWWAPDWQRAVIELVESVIVENPQIDARRVYLTGVSMGSYGSWEILLARPELFAGAVLVCGAGREEASAASLQHMPIWALHSEDDPVVPYDAPGSDFRIFQALAAAGTPVTWSIWDAAAPQSVQVSAAKNAVLRAATAESRHIFTTFDAGTTPRDPHHSWAPTYNNPVILDWLFAQARGA